jgi:hypothetical protein
MKKLLLFASLLLVAGGASAQGKIKTYKNAYIWAQSNRNAAAKGSALSTKDGLTYSLANVLKKIQPKDIDILCAYGKIGKKADAGFCLFAPDAPGTDINWDKSGGTVPYRYFEASATDADGASALTNWKVRNATKLQLVSDVDFDNATCELLNDLTVADNYIAGNLEVGSIIAFETAATSSNPAKKGLIKIAKIDDDEREDKAGQSAFQCLQLIIKVQR